MCRVDFWYYTAGTYGKGDAFVVADRNGRCGRAQQVPRLASITQGGDTGIGADDGIGSVSCAAAGDCSVSGTYTGRRGAQQVFVVSEKNGAWGTATTFPAQRP